MLTQQEEIIRNSLNQLSQGNHVSSQDVHAQKLLGLPSYEESVRSNLVKKDDEMMRFERHLSTLLYSGIQERSEPRHT
jgi:hypothetical protein